MRNIFGEIVISAILVIFLILLLNPFDFIMPNSMEMILSLGLALIFIIFVGFFWKEKVLDEREGLHRYIAGRFAYFAGVVFLTVGIVIQNLQHNLDGWLAVTLIAMIVAKIIGFLYGRLKH